MTDAVSLNSVAYGEGMFVGTSSFSEAVFSEDDGQTWTTVPFPGFEGANSMVFGGGRFVALGGRTLAFSDDAMTWTSGTTPVSLREVTYSSRAQSWAGISSAGAQPFLTSADGASWSVAKDITGQTFFSTLVGL